MARADTVVRSSAGLTSNRAETRHFGQLDTRSGFSRVFAFFARVSVLYPLFAAPLALTQDLGILMFTGSCRMREIARSSVRPSTAAYELQQIAARPLEGKS